MTTKPKQPSVAANGDKGQSLYDALVESARSAFQGIIATGFYLTKMNELLPDGMFGPVLEREFGLTEQQAQQFMAVYRRSKAADFVNFDGFKIDASMLLIIPAFATNKDKP